MESTFLSIPDNFPVLDKTGNGPYNMFLLHSMAFGVILEDLSEDFSQNGYKYNGNFPDFLQFQVIGESRALRSGVWFRANNLMIMMTQHNFCLLFD